MSAYITRNGWVDAFILGETRRVVVRDEDGNEPWSEPSRKPPAHLYTTGPPAGHRKLVGLELVAFKAGCHFAVRRLMRQMGWGWKYREVLAPNTGTVRPARLREAGAVG